MNEAIKVLRERVNELSAESKDKQLDNEIWIVSEEASVNRAIRSELLGVLEKLERIEMQKQHIDC